MSWLTYPKNKKKKQRIRFTRASFLSHVVIVMFDETFLATTFLLANPTGSESFNFARNFFSGREQHTGLIATLSC